MRPNPEDMTTSDLVREVSRYPGALATREEWQRYHAVCAELDRRLPWRGPNV